MNATKQEIQLKKFRQASKDYSAASRSLHTGLEPCEPFQHGWIRQFELREDVARRWDAHIFLSILKVINTRQWCRHQDFTTRFGRKVLPMDPPALDVIHVNLTPVDRLGRSVSNETIINLRGVPYAETGWSLPEHYKKWFTFHDRSSCRCARFFRRTAFGFYPTIRPHYTFSTPWMFELKVRPAIISEVATIRAEQQSKMDRISQMMDQQHGWTRLYGGYRSRDREWQKEGVDRLEMDDE